MRWPLVLGGSDMVVPSLVTDQNRMQLMQSSAMHIGKEPTVAPWNPRTKKGAEQWCAEVDDLLSEDTFFDSSEYSCLLEDTDWA